MRIRAVEEATFQVEVECPLCGYIRVLTLSPGEEVVKGNCLVCSSPMVAKKKPTIHHQKDL